MNSALTVKAAATQTPVNAQRSGPVASPEAAHPVQRLADASPQVASLMSLQRLANLPVQRFGEARNIPLHSGKPALGAHGDVAQCVMTRSMVDQFVEYYLEYRRVPEAYETLDEYEKHLVRGRIESATGMNLLTSENGQQHGAEENSDFDHPNVSDAEEITPNDPRYQSYVQLKRGPGLSGRKTFTTTNVGNYTDVEYRRDNDGNIDFSFPVFHNQWRSPEKGPVVDLSEDSKNPEYGKTLSNNFVHIPGASRQQHFSIANRVAKKYGNTAGDGGNSPAGWTWHHLQARYKMVLIDRNVHQKFGHNGGFYFW